MQAERQILNALGHANLRVNLEESLLREQISQYPWFAAPRILLARRDAHLDHPNAKSSLSSAAVYAFSRARLKAFLEGDLDPELSALLEQDGLRPATAEPEPEKKPEPAEEPEEAPEPAAEPEPEKKPEPADKPKEAPEPASEPEPEKEPEPADKPEEAPEPAAEPEPEVEREPVIEPEQDKEPSPMVEPEAAHEQSPEMTAAQPQDSPARSFRDWLKMFPASAGTEQNPSTTVEEKLAAEAIQPEERPEQAPAELEDGRHKEFSSAPHLTESIPQLSLYEDSDELSSLIQRQRELHGKQRSGGVKLARQSSDMEAENAEQVRTYPQTETFAKILAAQGKWQEAEALYQALSLRYPEKSGFFALQIQELQSRRGSV